VLVTCLVAARDALATITGGVGALTTLIALSCLILRLDRQAHQGEVGARWERFEREFRRYAAQVSDERER
jgi:hypothetical protein